MIAKLLISSSVEAKTEAIEEILSQAGLKNSHPDLLYFSADAKLGIEQARAIKEHFSLKPYSAQGRAVVFEDAASLTDEAQNALLKTLEELPEHALFILATDSDSKLLPTVVSRCEIINLASGHYDRLEYHSKYEQDLENLLNSSIEERFEYIEKLKDREEFFHSLLDYFHKKLPAYGAFTKELLQAEEWAKQNVNIRGILEYLMLVMPGKL